MLAYPRLKKQGRADREKTREPEQKEKRAAQEQAGRRKNEVEETLHVELRAFVFCAHLRDAIGKTDFRRPAK